MQLIFLGTSAGSPSKTRNVTSIALRFSDGRVWLFDCGEGTQQQILKSDIRPAKIEKIFITHFHGDHWYGLPGLLSSLKVHGRIEDVEIYSPEGMKETLETIYALSRSESPFQKHFFTTRPDESCEWSMSNGVQVRSCLIDHSVPSYAYALVFPDKPGRFLIERARDLKIDNPEYLQKLSRGGDVTVNGSVYKAEDFRGPTIPGMRVVILGDTCDASNVKDICQEPDWLVHEATYDETLTEKALQFKHATAKMAGQMAHHLKAKNLILTHFSSRYTAKSNVTIADLCVEAQKAAPHAVIHAAEDFKVFDLSEK